MGNVLSEEKKQQVIALGRLGWSLRRIETAAHLRRETAGAYLRAAGIAVRPPGGWGRNAPKPAIEVSTDSDAEKPPRQSDRSHSASACAPYREVIEAELAKGRNAMAIWQDLVDCHGFAGRYASVKRFVHQIYSSRILLQSLRPIAVLFWSEKVARAHLLCQRMARAGRLGFGSFRSMADANAGASASAAEIVIPPKAAAPGWVTHEMSR